MNFFISNFFVALAFRFNLHYYFVGIQCLSTIFIISNEMKIPIIFSLRLTIDNMKYIERFSLGLELKMWRILHPFDAQITQNLSIEMRIWYHIEWTRMIIIIVISLNIRKFSMAKDFSIRWIKIKFQKRIRSNRSLLRIITKGAIKIKLDEKYKRKNLFYKNPHHSENIFLLPRHANI